MLITFEKLRNYTSGFATKAVLVDNIEQYSATVDCLIFATSQNSSQSKWMPWELGFKDADRNRHGFTGCSAVLPVVEQANTSFQGKEYLRLYPIV